MISTHLPRIIDEYRCEWLNTVKTANASNRNGTAFHEAGHIVAALIQDTTIFNIVTINSNSVTKSLGATDGIKKLNVTLEQIVIVDFAGPVAESKFCPVYDQGITKDWRHALSQINYILEDQGALSNINVNDRGVYEALFRPTYEQLLSQAETMIDDYYLAVKFIGEKLLAKGTLTGKEIEDFWQQVK